MPQKNRSFSRHFSRALGWLAANSLFALAPLIFLKAISLLSEDNIASKEIMAIVESGIILFVACMLCGAVFTGFLQSGFWAGGPLTVFAVYLSPFCFLLYLFLKYLLLYIQYGDDHPMGPGGFSTALAAAFAIVYCTFVKTLYFIRREDAGHQLNLQSHT